MYSNSEYSSLLAKYNRAVGENLSLKDQLRQNNQRMETRETEIKRDYDSIRAICEEILSKDNDEMVVGTEYSWSRMSIYELIERTTISYRKYNRDRAELMMRLADLAEERAEQISSLCEQIEQYKNMYETGNQNEEAPASQQEQSNKEAPAEQERTVECESIKIEDDDLTNAMMSSMVDAIRLNESVKVTPPVIPISEPRAMVERTKKVKEKVSKAVKPALIDLNEVKSKFNNVMNEIIHVMGETGASLYPDIRDKVSERCNDLEKGISESRIRAAVNELVQSGTIQKGSFHSPLKGNINIMKLTLQGNMIYKDLFGSKAVISEMDMITAEHDNTEHGYGIKELAEVLEASGKYRAVTWKNGRKPIVLKDGQSVIPDIIAKTDKYTEYFEYERANHTYPDFQVKLTKLSHISRYINIVVQNTPQLDAILKDVERWGKESEVPKQRKVIVRISTVKYYSTHEPGTKNAWMYEYNTETGKTTNLSENNESAKKEGE